MKVDYACADRYRFLTGILLDKTVLLCNVVGDLHACGVERELPRGHGLIIAPAALIRRTRMTRIRRMTTDLLIVVFL